MTEMRWLAVGGEAGGEEGFAALGAGAAAAAVSCASFIAGVGQRVVYAEGGSAAADIVFGQQRVGSAEFDMIVGAFRDGPGHGADESFAAIGVNGVVATMVGNHHRFETAALGQTGCHAEHDAVAEGDHR